MMNEPKLNVDENGTKYWMVNKFYHREDGPAIETTNGSKYWYINGKRHRVDGPAVVYGGSKHWYFNGKRHREDGPAVEWPDGRKEWWVNNRQLTENEFYDLTKEKPKSLRLSFKNYC
jgi:hypothetical protein